MFFSDKSLAGLGAAKESISSASAEDNPSASRDKFLSSQDLMVFIVIGLGCKEKMAIVYVTMNVDECRPNLKELNFLRKSGTNSDFRDESASRMAPAIAFLPKL
jgi:hypothetical protein